MSILIKGMEMPEFGEKIIILTSSGYVEDVSGQVIGGVEIVPIPPHGRLIDADELFPLYADLLDGRDVQLVIPKIVIDTAPTIIEAEPPKEEAECSK